MKIGRRLAATGFLGLVYVTFQCGGGPPTLPTPCEIRADGGGALDVTTADGRLRLEIDSSGRRTFIITIRGVERFRRESWPEDGVYRTHGSLTDARGVSHTADLTVREDIVTGVVEGRAIAPFRKGDSYDTLRFDGGGEAIPSTAWEPRALDIVQELSRLAREQATKCSVVENSEGIETRGVPAVLENPLGSNACALCLAACTSAGVTCAIACGISCAPLGFPAGLICAAICGAGCGIVAAACTATCLSGGSVCCPVVCGGRCCNSGSTCALASPGLCCPSGTGMICAVGSTINCCFTNETCNTTTAACCPNPGQPCGTKCCASPTTKCADVPSELCCAPMDATCTGANSTKFCCASGTTCAPNTNNCCPNAQVICNGTCCAPGEFCFGGAVPQCTQCPIANQCGTKCCPPAAPVCVNSGTETCCDQANACGTECCITGVTTCTTGVTKLCCANDKFCDTVCCGQNQTCVAPGNCQ